MGHLLLRAGALMALSSLVALGACSSSPDAPRSGEEDRPAAVPLSATDHLVRASMSLRGVRPSLDDLRAVDGDPAALEGIVDAYLASPEFGRAMRDLHNEALLVRPDYPYFPAGFQPKPPLEGTDLNYLNRSIMEAPLRLIEHVIVHDRPYTEIVTADYTLANPVVASVWAGLSHDPGGPEWQVTKWSDGRGNAGILSDAWLFARHSSTPSNANRGRANAISKALLCYDFLSRDIPIDASINLADPNVVQDAVVKNDACASCHQALDPLASFFSGFYPIFVAADVTYPFTAYYPDLFETILGIDMRDPSYFGQAGATLEDLGAMIADDPRFSLCTARRFYAYFHQMDIDDVPLEIAAELQGVLTDSGMSAKALAKAIVLRDDFRASHASPASSDAQAGELVGMKKTRPEQLAYTIADLTGFRWEVDLTAVNLGRVELPLDSFLGYQVIGGGIDSMYVTRPSYTDNATTSLFLRAFAAEAAAHVVSADLAQPDDAARRLLQGVSEADVDEAAVREALARLHARILAELVEPGSEEVTETYGLFRAAYERSGDARRAWQATLTAMLQDVRVAYH